jgi:hypothetical protein
MPPSISNTQVKDSLLMMGLKYDMHHIAQHLSYFFMEENRRLAKISSRDNPLVLAKRVVR